MYQSPSNPNHIIPDLLKYQCWNEECEKQFILSDAYDNSNAKCPYCGSSNVEAIVFLEDPDRLEELGCMAISAETETSRILLEMIREARKARNNQR